MASQGWVSLLTPDNPVSSGAGALFTESATTAALSPQTSVANQDYAVINAPGQYLGWRVGLIIRVTARGFITTNATTGTLTYSLRANKNNSVAAASNTVLATANGLTTGATTVTGFQFKLEAIIRCTAIASSGNTVSSQGDIEFGIVDTATPALPANPIAINTATGVGMTLFMPNASGETAAAVDTTQPQGIQFCATATAASGSTQCTQWIVEVLD